MTIEKALAGEVSFFQDPEMALKMYNEYGFHLEKNVFDPSYCDQLIDESQSLSGAKSKNFSPFMMPHRENPIYEEALKQKKIVAIIDKLVGGTAVGLQTQFFYCKPGTRGFSNHQDNFFVQANFGVFASAWVPLVDIEPGNGGLIIYPGTHKEGLLPVRPLHLDEDPGQDRNANNEEVVIPEKYSPVDLQAPRGSALFIHGHLVHGSNANKSDNWRYVLLSTYIKTGEAFRSGNYAQREPVALS